jgi:hypothetical protein
VWAQRSSSAGVYCFNLITDHPPALLQVINFNLLCEESLLRYQQTYGLVSVCVPGGQGVVVGTRCSLQCTTA